MDDKEKKTETGRGENINLPEDSNPGLAQRLSGLFPVNISYFCARDCEPEAALGNLIRSVFLMYLVRSGKGKLVRKGKVFDVGKGQAFLVYPGDELSLTPDRNEPLNTIWIGFFGFQAQELMEKAGFTQDNPVVDCPVMPQMLEIMEHLVVPGELTYGNELMRTGYVYQLLALLVRTHEMPESHSRVKEKRDTEYVMMAVNLLVNAKDSQARIGEVAKRIGVSRGYLTSLFKKEMKISPQEYLMNYRLEKARSLLAVTEDPIGTIAGMVGYTDVMSFSKSFRRRFGLSPTQFRKQCSSAILHKQ